MMYHNWEKNSKIGFTLAEVLITLGIIGVIAGMTIPTLMRNIQDKQFKEAAKEAFSKTSQAVQQMKLDEGGDLSGYYTVRSSFEPIFIKYFKTIKDCGINDACVTNTWSGSGPSNIYNALTGEAAYTWFMAHGQFITTDGMFFAIYNYGGAGGTICITVDVNGYQKGPNVYGRDVFAFQLLNDSLVPMGTPNTLFYSSSSYYCKKNTHDNLQGIGCMINVMQGIDY